MDEQMQEIIRSLALDVPSIEKYKQVVKELNEPEVIDSLPTGGHVGWFGSKNAKKVIAFVPGGGFSHNASVVHLTAVLDMYNLAKERDAEVAFAFLAYDVCTAKPYPAQIDQGVRFIEHLLINRYAKDIELFGESAGGTIILASLLHAKHEHPKVAPISFPSTQKIGRILLISPSGPVFTSAKSMTENQDKDSLKSDNLKHLWSVIEANHDPEVNLTNPWLTPALRLEEGWYKDLPVDDLSIVWGQDEILRDDIARVAEVIQRNHPSSVKLRVAPGAGHTPFIFEKLFSMPASEYTQAMQEWFQGGW